VSRVKKEVKDVRLNGPAHPLHSLSRLPNNINLSFKGLEGEALMLYLDASGISVSTASACSTGSTELSHVIKSIGVPKEWASGTVRLTLGKYTDKTQLDYVIKILPSIVAKF
jgi:cysteine desulfurase